MLELQLCYLFLEIIFGLKSPSSHKSPLSINRPPYKQPPQRYPTQTS